jgi:hypothetical protein
MDFLDFKFVNKSMKGNAMDEYFYDSFLFNEYYLPNLMHTKKTTQNNYNKYVSI